MADNDNNNDNNNNRFWRTDGNNVDADDWLGTRNNQPLRIRTNNTQRMIITPAGNVGVGTETPETATGGLALHIHNPNGASALRLGDGAVNGQQWEWQSTVINNVGAMNLSKLTPPLANPLTVLANGNVGIGTTTPQGRLDVLGEIRAGNSDIYFTNPNHNHTAIGNTAGFAAIENAANFGALMILGRTTSTAPLRRTVRLWDFLEVNGDLDVTGVARKPGGGPWGVLSDVRLKKSIEPLKHALGKLLQLRGVSFEWKEPEKQGNLVGQQMGLVAQEVEEVFPEWVDTDTSGYKILSVRGFEALTIEAFKELKADNEALRSRIEALERA
jgi:hypothetical protein